MFDGSSVVELVKDLRHQVNAFLREEVHLAKAELSEKISHVGKDVLGIAIGGLVACAGLTLFLDGLGILIGFAFKRLGIDPLLSAFFGLGIVGLTVVAVGSVMLLTALNALKKESLTPERTIETLQNIKGTTPTKSHLHIEQAKDERSSAEIEASVVQTEKEMAQTLEELGDRLTMAHLKQQADVEIRQHPYRWSLVALGAGVCGSYLMKRKLAR
jgi:hypothetical protein